VTDVTTVVEIESAVKRCHRLGPASTEHEFETAEVEEGGPYRAGWSTSHQSPLHESSQAEQVQPSAPDMYHPVGQNADEEASRNCGLLERDAAAHGMN